MEDSIESENQDSPSNETNIEEEKVEKSPDTDVEDDSKDTEIKPQMNGHGEDSTMNETGALIKEESSSTTTKQNEEMNDHIQSDIIQQPSAPVVVDSKPSDYSEFAAIHSFLTMFGVELDLPNVSLIDLEQIFSTNHQLSIDKGDFHCYSLIVEKKCPEIICLSIIYCLMR